MKNKKAPLSPADNGITYLPKGNYTLHVTTNGTTAKTEIIVQ